MGSFWNSGTSTQNQNFLISRKKSFSSHFPQGSLPALKSAGKGRKYPRIPQRLEASRDMHLTGKIVPIPRMFRLKMEILGGKAVERNILVHAAPVHILKGREKAIVDLGGLTELGLEFGHEGT